MTSIQHNTKIKLVQCVILLILCGYPGLFAQQTPETDDDQCVICHLDVEVIPEDYKAENIHFQKGLSCAGCHGGDPTSDDMEEAKRPGSGFIGVPSRAEIPNFCGRCHSDINIMREYQPRIPTDQVEQFYTSVHGKKLKAGDNKVAECVSCHTAHGILPTEDPRSTVHALNIPSMCNKCHGDADYMNEYRIDTRQYEEYTNSVHGIALLENQDTGAPACNDCHGNHGAIPPGVASISHVCGTCHVNNMQYFAESVMGKAFDELELHACEECHGNHDVKKTSDQMIGGGELSICKDCHSEGEAGFDIANKINMQLVEIAEIYKEAQSQRLEVHQVGMSDVEIGYLLQDANQNLIKARTLVHTFDPVKVGEETSAGIQKAQDAIHMAKLQISDYQTRRRGFGIATGFITLLVVALFFKIRDMENKNRKE